MLVKRISNIRASKGSNAEFATSTTNGSMFISRDAMARHKWFVGDALLIESADAEAAGLQPTFENGADTIFLVKGYAAPEKGLSKSVGNKIVDTNNKNVIGNALLYKELKGNNAQRNNFKFSDPIYGFLTLADGTVMPITKDTPEDEGVVEAYVRREETKTTEAGETYLKVTIEIEETEWSVAECKENGLPIYALEFVGSTDKIIKNVGAGKTTGKAAGKTKVAAAVEDEDEFEEA